MVIVFSGFRDDTLKAQIEAAGGKVAVTLVKAATHLLCKKGSKQTKKLEEATARGITIQFLEDFVEEHRFDAAAMSEASTSTGNDGNEELELLCKFMKVLSVKLGGKEGATQALEMLIRLSS